MSAIHQPPPNSLAPWRNQREEESVHIALSLLLHESPQTLKESDLSTSQRSSAGRRKEGRKEETAGMGWDGIGTYNRDGDDREGSGGYGA